MKKEDWIKVEDRLPEAEENSSSSKYVLVAYKVDHAFGMYEIEAEMACYDYDERMWIGTDSDGLYGTVTHWMPIILPNREQDELERD